ncbi:MAG TPA: aryl-sulfate sulfotransferase [Bacteroidia bacterium]|nr:aryl-sulfate sulfotransferase [Bacteroidia bacterium]
MKKMNKLYLVIVLAIFNNLSKAQQWDGYFLTAAKNATSATLYDTTWTSYHTWTGLTGSTGYSSYLMPGGYLWRAAKATSGLPTGAPGGPICGRITKHDYNGTLLWDYLITGTDFVSHHDIRPLPNGNVLAIVYERKTAAEVVAAGCTTYSNQMWPDKIIEVQPTGLTTGTVVWEWRSWDHLMQNTDPTKANYVTSLVDNPQLLNINYQAQSDWQHMNGVDYNPMLDQISFSSHNHDEWYIIDHSTTTAEAASHSGGFSGKGGDILYRWGNPAAYGAAGSAILNVTHDAHWADEFSTVPGRLCGYNNKGVSANQSSADQIITPINGYNYTITAGSAYTPASYTSRKTVSGMYSSNEGGTQQLPNGNEIVCSPVPSGTVREFNSAGQLVYSHSGSGSKIKKYSACFINNTPPAIPTITENASVLSATSAAAYQWYLNGQQISGANAQTYTPTQSGNYLVRITDSNACVYQYSKTFVFTMTPSAVMDVNFSDKINFYPNPTAGIISFSDASLYGKQFSINVIDQSGKIVNTFYNANKIDISSLPNGNYFIQLISPEGSATKQIVLNK